MVEDNSACDFVIRATIYLLSTAMDKVPRDGINDTRVLHHLRLCLQIRKGERIAQ